MCKQEGASSDPQHPHKDRQAHTCHLNTGEEKQEGSVCSKIREESDRGRTSDIKFWLSLVNTSNCVHTHTESSDNFVTEKNKINDKRNIHSDVEKLRKPILFSWESR